MLGSRLLRRLGRRVAAHVARRVAEDELFEKPQERPPQAAVFTAPTPAPPPTPMPTPPLSGSAGCVPVDLVALRARLGPGGGLRVVNHWATWCDPCVEELPVLAMLHESLGGTVAFLGVSWDLFEGGDPVTTARRVADFAAEHGILYPSLLVTAEPDDFFAALGIDAFQKIPQTWVVDDAGRVRHRIEGIVDVPQAEELTLLLRGLLGT